MAAGALARARFWLWANTYRPRLTVHGWASLAAARAARGALDRAASPQRRLYLVNRIVPGGAHQHRAEIEALLHLLASRRPERVLEIGVADGGTNVLLSRCAPSVRMVIGVDLRLRRPALLRALAPVGLELHLIEGSSHAPDVVERVRGLLNGAALDVLFVDGDHSRAGVLADIEAYRPLVRPGGLIVLHDIVPDDGSRGGEPTFMWAGDVPAVWRELAADAGRTWEFVDSWDQDGYGIGVLEAD